MEKIKAETANIVTVSRMLFSLLLLGFPPSSSVFAMLYLLCGVTDVLDGFLARKLHLESKAGERLDSIADIVFAAVYAVKILPVLLLPLWIWIWTALIAMVKIFGIIKRSKMKQRSCIEHSIANKMTGLLIFLLPLTAGLIDADLGAAVVCTVATFAATEDLLSRKVK